MTAKRLPDPIAAPDHSPLVLVAAVALIDGEGRILIAQRAQDKSMAGLWEFPGGKLEPGETPEAALVRELAEELDIRVKPADLAPLTFASHSYDDFHLLMPVFICRRWQGRTQPREHDRLRWVAADKLVDYPMPPADAPLIDRLVALV